jgi:hypothetical protein
VTVALLASCSAAAAVLLVAAYGIGAPFLLLRTLLLRARQRRLRYRGSADDVLAISRFTIPVSLIAPVDGTGATDRLRALLELRYSEIEVIAVTSDAATLGELRETFDLGATEVFYRRSLPTGLVRRMFRSASDPRLLVIETAAGPVGAHLNAGVNLARNRYIGVVDVPARFKPDALLEAMHAALEDPQRVVGVTTGVAVASPEPAESVLHGAMQTGVAGALRYLRGARARLMTVGRRRLDLPPGGCPGFTIWRRDVVLECGGFASSDVAAQADLVFRVHRHYRGDRRRYRVVHVSEPVGVVEPEAAEALMRTARVPAHLIWRYRTMLFNPALGRLGLWDLPRYAFNQLAAPWIELAALLLLVPAVALGVLSAGQLLLVLFVVGLGNGVLIASALLLAHAEGGPPARPAALCNLIFAAPLEYFVSRPALLLERFRRA